MPLVLGLFFVVPNWRIGVGCFGEAEDADEPD
jgi:hypothetical protein